MVQAAFEIGACDASLDWAGAQYSQSPMAANGGAVMGPSWRETAAARWSILLTLQKNEVVVWVQAPIWLNAKKRSTPPS